MFDLRVLALTSCVSALAVTACDNSNSSGDTTSTGGSTSGTDSATGTSGTTETTETTETTGTTSTDSDPRCGGPDPSEGCCSADGTWTCTAASSCDERAELHAACGFEVDKDWQSSCTYWEDLVDNGNSCEQECYSSSLQCMLATPESCEDPAGKQQTCASLQDDEACLLDNCGEGSTGGSTGGGGTTSG